MTVAACVNVLFSSADLHVCFCASTMLFITIALKHNLESGVARSPAFLLLSIALAIQSL